MPLNLASIRAAIPGREIHWHDSISSTMYEAVRLANAGAPNGTVVGAEEQTSGHGRYNRQWHSEKESGLYQTIILRLPVEPQHVPVVTLALGLATASAISHTAGLHVDLRWPNDALIGEKKVAGILVQLHGQAVVAGIGINVNQESFPPEVSEIATSLRIATGHPQEREPLLIALLSEIDEHTKILAEQGIDPILKMFTRASSYTLGRRVIVDEQITGTTMGLTPEGFLRMKKDDGTEHIVLAGGVRALATSH